MPSWLIIIIEMPSETNAISGQMVGWSPGGVKYRAAYAANKKWKSHFDIAEHIDNNILPWPALLRGAIKRYAYISSTIPRTIPIFTAQTFLTWWRWRYKGIRFKFCLPPMTIRYSIDTAIIITFTLAFFTSMMMMIIIIAVLIKTTSRFVIIITKKEEVGISKSRSSPSRS